MFAKFEAITLSTKHTLQRANTYHQIIDWHTFCQVPLKKARNLTLDIHLRQHTWTRVAAINQMSDHINTASFPARNSEMPVVRLEITLRICRVRQLASRSCAYRLRTINIRKKAIQVTHTKTRVILQLSRVAKAMRFSFSFFRLRARRVRITDCTSKIAFSIARAVSTIFAFRGSSTRQHLIILT